MYAFLWYRGRHLNWDVSWRSPMFVAHRPVGQDAMSRSISFGFRRIGVIELVLRRPY